ncbi:MAG: ABC transporter permease [bacterium]
MREALRLSIYYAPLGLILLGWEAGSRTGLLNEDLVPSFSSVLAAFWELLISGDLVFHAAVSLWRAIAGFFLGVSSGVVLGIGMARSRIFRIVVEPLVSITYPLPKSALIPVLLLWFGIGHSSKIAAIFLGCLLPVVISTYNSTRGVDPQIVWSARSLGTSEASILWKVVLMAALPEILSGVRIALALTFVLLISSELLIARAGLGYLISFMGDNGEYSLMFAVVMAVTLIGFFADRAYVGLMRRLLRWQEQSA